MVAVCVIGDARRAEFQPAIACLRAASGTTPLEFRAEWNHVPQTFDLIVVLQSHPDEFAPSRVLELLCAAGIARIVCLAGAWCEAEGRTRGTWPVGVRCPVSQSVPRLQRELAVLAGEVPATPLTLGRDEVFAIQHPVSTTAHGAATIVVLSPDSALAQTWQALLVQAGFHADFTLNDDPSRTISAIAWDADPGTEQRFASLMELRLRNPAIPILACTDCPLPERLNLLIAAGATTVLPKLSGFATLLQSLKQSLDVFEETRK